MTIQFTIIGLGQIGASIGLALAERQNLLYRVGHDRDVQIARQAEKLGAVDHIELNLPNAVRKAEVVLLALPLDQIQETLSLIAPDLKEGAVVMDTGPIKQEVIAWAEKLLPADRYYVGLTPSINPAYLHEAGAGLEAAHADLFQSGVMAIVTPPRTNSGVIKLATDLTALLGSSPLFADAAEVDGLMAAMHILPQLLAAALLNATVDQPGWREGRKLAGRPYAQATAPIVYADLVQALKSEVWLNQANVLRLLDGTIAALETVRSDISTQNDGALKGRLEKAHQGRQKWLQERQAANWVDEGVPPIDIPESPGVLGRLFGIQPRPRRLPK
jgi:prephenate dehydrogenase